MVHTSNLGNELQIKTIYKFITHLFVEIMNIYTFNEVNLISLIWFILSLVFKKLSQLDNKVFRLKFKWN